MVARGPGAVGCAHCLMIGADRSCAICTHLVCETCANDWTTCGEPSGRVIRLGLTARLRDVDPSGRLGLVTHWRRTPRLFDLRQLRWIDGVFMPRGAYVWNRRFPPRLTSDGRAIYASWSAGTGFERSDSRLYDGMHVEELHTKRDYIVLSDAPEHGTAVSATRDHFYYVTSTQRVAIIVGRGTYEVEPLPRKVVQAVHLDAERGLLASASWSELALHRLVDGKLELVSHRKTDAAGDVIWIATAGGWLVAAVKRFAGATAVEIWRLEDNLSIGNLVGRSVATELSGAALSRDGRHLALAIDGHLDVHELGTEREDRFEEHSDRINLVRFAGDDHLLVTADTDNRVVMRPRTPAGYARPLVHIDVPEAGIPLPPPDPKKPE